ncbi:MAG: DUF5710 domain-containing protein [Maricaulaceae bacterium]
MTKQYLSIDYSDRNLAKRLGARWDPSVKKWYCEKGSALSKIFSWRAAPKAGTLAVMPSHATNQNFELPLAS